MSNLSFDDAMNKQIESAVRTLSEGGVAAIPTDTLYGLAACAFDESAVLKVYELKGRPDGMALPLLLSDADDALSCAVEMSEDAWKLARVFWPGALTLVVRKSSYTKGSGREVPDVVTAGLDTVALRVPDHPVPRAIAKGLGAPITGTSANMSGRPGLTSAEAVRREFGRFIGPGGLFVLDGGGCSKNSGNSGNSGLEGVASTIVDVSGDAPKILRMGAVSEEEISAALGWDLR